MKKIKMVALDLDGTTLNRHSEISERTCRALHDAMEKGVHIVISTGRAFDAIPESVFCVDGLEYIINSNGADITKVLGRECIYTNHIDEDAVLRTLELFENTDRTGISFEAVIERTTFIGRAEYDCIVSGNSTFREIAYVRDTRTPVDNIFSFVREKKDRIENINIIFETKELKEKWKDILADIPGTTLTTSFANNYEIGGATTSKAEALRFLMERLDVKQEELLACGDSPNDEEMIRFAGFGVAMGNALPEVKEIADYVTASNEEDGVAEVIEKFVL